MFLLQVCHIKAVLPRKGDPAQYRSRPVPFRARWLDIIGLIFFFFNICLFTTNTTLLVMRFRLSPGSLRQSFTDQVESLFIPASVSCSDPQHMLFWPIL